MNLSTLTKPLSPEVLKRKLRESKKVPARGEWSHEPDLGYVFKCWGVKLLTKNDRRGEHWGTAKRRQDEMKLLVAQRGRPCIKGRAFVSFWRFYGGAVPCDEDNLTGSVANALDALRYAKVIVNDSPKDIELHVQQQRRKRGGPEWLCVIREAR